MKNTLDPNLTTSGHVKNKVRDRVFHNKGEWCHYPGCNLKVSPENPLCIHDTTYTGQHTNLKELVPLCRTHHNQATNDHRRAERVIRRFQRNLRHYGCKQTLLFEE